MMFGSPKPAEGTRTSKPFRDRLHVVLSNSSINEAEARFPARAMSPLVDAQMRMTARRRKPKGGAGMLAAFAAGVGLSILTATAPSAETPVVPIVDIVALACAGDLDRADEQIRRHASAYGSDASALFLQAWLARFFGDLVKADRLLDQVATVQAAAPLRDACTGKPILADWTTLVAQLRGGAASVPLPLPSGPGPALPTASPAPSAAATPISSLWSPSQTQTTAPPEASRARPIGSPPTEVVQIGTLSKESSVEPLIGRVLRAAPDQVKRQNAEIIRMGTVNQIIVLRFLVNDAEKTCSVLAQAKLDCLILAKRQAGK